MIEVVTNWMRRRSRAEIDLMVIAGLAIPLYLFIVSIGAFDRTYQWTRAHEGWQLDELIAFVSCLGIAALVYAARRLTDLKAEIARRQAAEEEARRLARHDPLTGLPNRRRFLEDFNDLADNLPGHWSCAVILVDLDRFKPINDLFGHRLGDEVLRVVAKRLRELVGDDGVVARLGGDEFGILLRCPMDDDLPVRLARRIVHEVPSPIPLAALSVEVGVSVGVALVDAGPELGAARPDGHRGNVEIALRQADMAMYRAKTEGRGLYYFYDSEMDESLQRRVQLEREIKGAIVRGEIVPFFQPVVDLKTEKTVGYEMLARWRHPTMGMLLPSLFIPIAEDTGSIAALTYNLLARAVEDAKSWPEDVCLSINLSPRQFADVQLPQKILGVLASAGFPPQRLECEITEAAVVRRLDEAKTALQALRDIGVKIALDDFGTSYAGLYHLRDLQLDAIKIDRSFISQMLVKREEGKIVEAMIGLAHTLGLQTTAEGIESEAVRGRLVELGCETGQGFLFGAAEPKAERHVGDKAPRAASALV